jgi:DNA-binding GntR family transcriptional regulator
MTQDTVNIGARRATLAGEVRSEVERRILSGEIASGEKLNELALANSMGVSRGTVREAVRSLADSGLVEFFANRGAFVRRLTVDEIGNLYDLRGAIFAMACAASARHAAHESGSALVFALKQNLADMRDAFERDDRPAYYELNIAFHDMLLAGAQNEKAKDVYDGLVKEMHLFRRRGLSIAMNIAQSISEHAAIVAAIEKADARAAREAALHHIESGLERFMATLADTGAGQEMPAMPLSRGPDTAAADTAGAQQGGGLPHR